MNLNRVYRRYLLPAFVFQSVVIGGAYGTGRELIEFFLSEGPIGGLLGILVSMAVFSAVAMVTYELARMWGAYDYRHFFKRLLGPAWWLFEACYVVLMLIVLAVVAAAAGSILEETFGLSYWIGVGAVITAVGALVFGGNEAIERFFSAWSFVLYGLYAVFFVWCFRTWGWRHRGQLRCGAGRQRVVRRRAPVRGIQPRGDRPGPGRAPLTREQDRDVHRGGRSAGPSR